MTGTCSLYIQKYVGACHFFTHSSSSSSSSLLPPFPVHIPVHRNRSIETTGTLYDSQMKVLRTFTTRTHGQNGPNGLALNELTSDGSTPTGLATFDLNSPEDDPASYGPYPVNRAVQGLKGVPSPLVAWKNSIFPPCYPLIEYHLLYMGRKHGFPDQQHSQWHLDAHWRVAQLESLHAHGW